MSKINPIQPRFVLGFSAAAFALAMATLVAQGQQPARVLSGPGPGDKHVVDPAGADRGRTVWVAECITCHGTQRAAPIEAPT
jgi:cytochrome c5